MPPQIAPRQIVIVPMLRDKPEDAELKSLLRGACEAELKAQGIRVLVDLKPTKSAEKRWNWVRRGAPVIVEIGGRDAAGGNVTFMRRDRAARRRQGGVAHAGAGRLRGRCKDAAGGHPRRVFSPRRRLGWTGNIVSNIGTFAELEAYFGAASATTKAESSRAGPA